MLSRVDQSNEVAADRVLSAVGRELREIAQMSEGLQFDISEVLKNFHGEAPIRVYQLQNLDRITQTVAGLAGFLERLAQSVPSSSPPFKVAEAAQAVSLADLAKRLVHCQQSDELTTDDEQKSGECAYF